MKSYSRRTASCAPRSAERVLPTAYRLPPTAKRKGFTLIELLVVIFIILLVSAVALPAILPALNHREISEAARQLQGALVGARDQAIHTNQPSGIRLMPDPTMNGLGPTNRADGSANPYMGLPDPSQILASSRILPLGPAPEYSEGMVTITSPNNNKILVPPGGSLAPLVPYPTTNGGGGGIYYPVTFGLPLVPGGSPQATVLMIEEWPYDTTQAPIQPNAPTSWFWNVRVGDKIQINGAGPWYTVVGPMVIPPNGLTIGGTLYANPEMFVNLGPPGVTPSVPLWVQRALPGGGTYFPEFLFLVNGQDDDGNGWADEGWDGISNNVPNGSNPYDPLGAIIDDLSEWETETWQGTLATQPTFNQPYTIHRRPAPTVNAREVPLPSSVVVDLTGWGPYINTGGGTNPAPYERSIVPGSMFNIYTGYVDIMVNPDGSILPTTIYSSPTSFSLGSAFTHLWLADRADVTAPSTTRTTAPFLPLPQGLAATLFNGQELKGNYALLTIFNRTGAIVVNENMTFDSPAVAAAVPRPYSPALPYLPAQQGVNGGG